MTTARQQINAILTGSVRYEAGLDALAVAPAAEVDAALVAVLDEACTRLWRRGWQPLELHRIVGRRGSQTQVHLLDFAIIAQQERFRPGTVDERWLSQADQLGGEPWWEEDTTYLAAATAQWRLDRLVLLDLMLTLLAILSELPPIEVLIPPPGTAPVPGTTPGASRAPVAVRHLARIRALLAKAESTTHPAEAETYTAKAQDLAARHSIDEALLTARSAEVTVVPFARRIGVDHPYEGERASLLDAVARANRCRMVWTPELGFATVFGFDADIDAVDLLYTSLLVQAHRAMASTEPPGGKANRARLRSYRQSFLVAFAVRIGERLASAAQAAVAEAGDAALLPVLRSRDEQVREAMHRSFPRTVRSRGSRVDSREGWDSGQDAADQAVLLDDSPTVQHTPVRRA